MKFIGIDNSFGQSGKRDTILEVYGLNVKNVKEKIKALLNLKIN